MLQCYGHITSLVQPMLDNMLDFSVATLLFWYLSHAKSHSSSPPLATAVQYTDFFMLTLILKSKEISDCNKGF